MVHAEYMVVKAGDSRQRAAAYVLIAAALAMLLFCACFSAIPTQEQIRESARQDFQRNLSQAEAGNAAAQRWLWLTYKRGNSVVERNPVEALRWLRSAAALGNPWSNFLLFVCIGGGDPPWVRGLENAQKPAIRRSLGFN